MGIESHRPNQKVIFVHLWTLNSIESAQQSDRQFTSTLDSFTFSPEKILSKESLAEVRRFQDLLWTSNQDGCEDNVL